MSAGHIIWCLERRTNPGEFGKSYSRGVEDGIYWAFTTATSTGYGDKTPTTVVGRLLAICWMICGILAFCLVATVIFGEMDLNLVDQGIYSFPDISYDSKVGVFEGLTLDAEEKLLGSTKLANYADYAGPPSDLFAELASLNYDAVVGPYPRLVQYVDHQRGKTVREPVPQCFPPTQTAVLAAGYHPCRQCPRPAAVSCVHDAWRTTHHIPWFIPPHITSKCGCGGLCGLSPQVEFRIAEVAAATDEGTDHLLYKFSLVWPVPQPSRTR